MPLAPPSLKDSRQARRRFLADRSASTAMEFGALLFPFLAFLGATLDAGMIYFRSAQLQNTAQSASRLLLTRALPAGATYESFIENHVCSWQATKKVLPGTLSTMFDCSRIIVDIQSPSKWSRADLDETFTISKREAVIEAPAPGEVAVLRIVYPVNTFFSYLRGRGNGLVKGYSDQLMGVVAVRVERTP